MKKCFKCEERKPVSDFYRHPQMGDGYLGKCKDCTKKDAEIRRHAKQSDPEWVEKERVRQMNKERKRRQSASGVLFGTYVKPRIFKVAWRGRNPEKMKAHNALNNAVRDGKVKSMPCVACGAKAHGHHEDYSKPLAVVWLCPAHHAARHVEMRAEKQRKPKVAMSV